jgi:hypothetical protein
MQQSNQEISRIGQISPMVLTPDAGAVTGCKTVDIAASDELAQGRIVKGFLQSKSVNKDARTADGLASTISLDRDGDVILPSAFRKDLKRFLATNAPFLAAHRHRSEDGSPTQIGWVMTAKVTATALQCTFQYAITDAAEQWWKLASDPAGKGHAFSVGFVPRRAIRGSVADAVRAYPELADVFKEAGLKGDDMVTVYTEVELLEISACPVPSNRQSLQLLSAKLFGMEDGAKATEELQKLIADSLESAIRNPQSAIRNLLQASIDNVISDFAVELDRQFAAVKSLLPDFVNPQADGSAREPAGEDDDAAAGKARAKDMRRAADALRGGTA